MLEDIESVAPVSAPRHRRWAHRLAGVVSVAVTVLGAPAVARADIIPGPRSVGAFYTQDDHALHAKVGQMASYVDGLVPESKRDAFEASLKVLRAQAPRSSSPQIRAVIEGELGAPIDELFASFDDVLRELIAAVEPRRDDEPS